MASNEDLIRTVLQGRYYYPAGAHYAPQNPYQSNVSCDNCGMRGLDACIGLESMDLCLTCNQNILDRYISQQTTIRISQRQLSFFSNLKKVEFIALHEGFLIN